MLCINVMPTLLFVITQQRIEKNQSVPMEITALIDLKLSTRGI